VGISGNNATAEASCISLLGKVPSGWTPIRLMYCWLAHCKTAGIAGDSCAAVPCVGSSMTAAGSELQFLREALPACNITTEGRLDEEPGGIYFQE